QAAGQRPFRDTELPRRLLAGAPLEVAEEHRAAILLRQAAQFLVQQGPPVLGAGWQDLRVRQVLHLPLARLPPGAGGLGLQGGAVSDAVEPATEGLALED